MHRRHPPRGDGVEEDVASQLSRAGSFFSHHIMHSTLTGGVSGLSLPPRRTLAPLSVGCMLPPSKVSSSPTPFALLSLAVLLAAPAAAAQEPPVAPDAPPGTPSSTVPPPIELPPPIPFTPRLVLDTGRVPTPPPEHDLVRFQVHGEYQLRAQGQSSFLMTPSATVLQGRPGATGDSLGQNFFLWHWL